MEEGHQDELHDAGYCGVYTAANGGQDRGQTRSGCVCVCVGGWVGGCHAHVRRTDLPRGHAADRSHHSGLSPLPVAAGKEAVAVAVHIGRRARARAHLLERCWRQGRSLSLRAFLWCRGGVASGDGVQLSATMRRRALGSKLPRAMATTGGPRHRIRAGCLRLRPNTILGCREVPI